jgi:hypothetical protein
MPTLTGELANAATPLRRWFAEHLPNCQPVYAGFRRTIAGECIEPAQYTAPGTLGAAYDYLVRYSLDHNADAPLARGGAAYAALEVAMAHAALEPSHRPESSVSWDGIAREAIANVRAFASGQNPWDEWDDGTAADAEVVFGGLAHGCWVLALLTELGRGVPLSRSPLRHYNHPSYIENWSCIPIPSPVVDDLRALHERAKATLLPFVETRGAAGSALMLGPDLGYAALAADADLIVGTTLIEIKAVAGKRYPNRSRRWGLDARRLYQLVGYALLALVHGDTVDEVVLFNARYNHLHSWPLGQLFSELAGREIRPAIIAKQFEEFLRCHYDS